MYFKLNKKQLKKALLYLNNKLENYNKKIMDADSYNYYMEYIEQIQFALYKTNLSEFYIDYDFAKEIRPALLTKEIKK